MCVCFQTVHHEREREREREIGSEIKILYLLFI